ncbi:mCG53597, partial [Mus musculus]
NSLCRPGWPQTQKSTCLCLPMSSRTARATQRKPVSNNQKKKKKKSFVLNIYIP